MNNTENLEMTDWFTDGTLPVRPGVYNVSCQKENQSGAWYAFFDGNGFGGCTCKRGADENMQKTFKRAILYYVESGLVDGIKSWRGIYREE
jgi:hypothetical protein